MREQKDPWWWTAEPLTFSGGISFFLKNYADATAVHTTSSAFNFLVKSRTWGVFGTSEEQGEIHHILTSKTHSGDS